MKKNAGFTLIELVVGIAISAIVLSAVSAVVLMGLHNNRLINQAATVQNDSRVITQLLQTLTSRGSITGVVKLGDNCVIQGENEDEETIPLLSFSKSSGTLSGGDGVTLMENVSAFEARLDENNNRVLTLALTVDGEAYERSIYCRTQRFAVDEMEIKLSADADDAIVAETITAVEEEEAEPDSLPEDVDLSATAANRLEFLKLLATQYGSAGNIQYGDGTDTGVSFAQWYNGGWDSRTPWCACFVSWAAYFANAAGLINEQPWTLDGHGVPHAGFAWVPNGIYYFKNAQSKNPDSQAQWKNAGEYAPNPGDYIFFDFDGNGEGDHVGVVLLHTEDDRVLTIEGNSGNHVSLREYSLGNTSIMGYGVLDWKTP